MSIKVGQQIEYLHGTVRVMAIAESDGWAMVRYKGRMPFCVEIKVLEKYTNPAWVAFKAAEKAEQA